VLCRCGHNEDRCADVDPATRVILVLSESTVLESSLPSVVGRVHAGDHGMGALGVDGH
jgi:hypothetical protein